jgi:DNA-binding transcriptional MerR regulator
MPKKQENIKDKAVESASGNGRLMSIREVSDLTGVLPHTLRFWEKQMPEILRPERTPGGQRRYSMQMAERARMIKRLSDEKRYSLASIRGRLATANRPEEPVLGARRRAAAEQMVDLIVNEVTGLLRGRLLKLFEADGLAERTADPDEHPGLCPVDLSRSVSEGGNGFGLDKHKE